MTKALISWNAGRTEWGRRGVDNFLLGASWSHWGNWPERQTHIYLGLWALTIVTPSKGGKTRRDLKPSNERF
ncbi:hypothetical protein SEA_HIRKO_77 [Arthrobacter phage Hirko]|nr:hypothetical protein SEA_HIRKO_77 [Arthrobacter phage Hirko]